MSRCIAIYGGSFNPVTNQHLTLAELILNEVANVEKVIFLPVGDLYVKQGLIPSTHRIEMLNKACKGNPRFEVCDLECTSDEILNTVDTMKLFKELYPDTEIYFVIGSDNLKEISSWTDSEQLIENNHFIIFERNDDIVEDIIKKDKLLESNKVNFTVLTSPVKTNCSSSIVRERICSNKSFRYLIPEAAYHYINSNNLYK